MSQHPVFLTAALPHREQRASFRTPVRLAESPACRVLVAPVQSCAARLEDISEGGVRLRLSSAAPGVAQTLTIGMPLRVTIAFERAGHWQCHGRLKYLQALGGSGVTRAGIVFDGLSGTHLKTLRRTLMRQQRRNIRNGLLG